MPQLPNAKLLQAFEATARHSSIATAAKELFITQSALSRQIKALENLLSLELFARQKNKLILTDLGRTLYGVVEKSLRDISACTANMQRGYRRITLKSSPSLATRWLAPRLAKFYENHPCMISVHISSFSVTAIRQDYDCELLFGQSNSPPANAKKLFGERIQPACSPETFAKIADNGIDSVPILHTLQGPTPMPYWDYWTLSNPQSEYVPSASSLMSGMEFGMLEQVMNAAIGGLGVGMVDVNIAHEALQNGQLVGLGNAIDTPYCYWAVEHQLGGEKGLLVSAFCQWLLEEAKLCAV